MSERAVGELLGRMMLDEDFRKSVQADPAKAIASFDLTAEERQRFLKADLAAFNGMIDGIWNRASLAFGFSSN